MERSIHEMLKDAPSLNESASAVHSGSPPTHIKKNRLSDCQPRPATMSLTLESPTSKSCTLLGVTTLQYLVQGGR